MLGAHVVRVLVGSTARAQPSRVVRPAGRLEALAEVSKRLRKISRRLASGEYMRAAVMRIAGCECRAARKRRGEIGGTENGREAKEYGEDHAGVRYLWLISMV